MKPVPVQEHKPQFLSVVLGICPSHATLKISIQVLLENYIDLIQKHRKRISSSDTHTLFKLSCICQTSPGFWKGSSDFKKLPASIFDCNKKNTNLTWHN